MPDPFYWISTNTQATLVSLAVICQVIPISLGSQLGQTGSFFYDMTNLTCSYQLSYITHHTVNESISVCVYVGITEWLPRVKEAAAGFKGQEVHRNA